MPHSFRRQSWLPLALILHLSPIAHAASLTWLGDLNANWSSGTSGTDTNWVSNTLPANGDSLIFNLTQSSVANLITTNDLSALTLGGTNAITFTNDTGTGTGFTLAGNAITLSGNITSTGTTGTHLHTIQLDLILSGTRTVTAANNTTIVISGNISESAAGSGLTKAGPEQVTLSGINSFSGPLSVNAGVLSANSIADSGISSAIGAGSIINLGSATTTAGTLTYTGAAATTNRTVNLAATTTGAATLNSSGTGALIFTGTFTNTGSGAKTLTLGGTSIDNNEIQSILSDGANGGTLALTKANGGTWLLSGLNTYTGNTTINQGILSINSIADSGTSSAIGAGSIINFGNVLQTGTLFYSGAAATTNRTLNLASTSTGGATIDASGTGALIFTGNVTNAATTGTKTLTLNGTATNNEFQGIISDGGNGGVVAVTKGDTGTWILSGLNTFTGAVSINRTSLTINSIADSGTASALGAGTTLNLGSVAQTGTLIYTGSSASTNRALVLASASTGGGTITNNGSGALIFTGTFSNVGTAAKTFTLSGTNTAANEFQAALTDSTGGTLTFVKTGLGSWTLSGTSTFTGALSINQGTLTLTSLGDTGVSTAAGAGSTINIGSGTNVAGTLVYTGSGASTNRAINLAATTNGGATLNSSGTGALIFTGVISNTGTGTKTLTLSGTSTASNEIQSAITDGSGTLVIAKSDTSSWVLSGPNTYTGGTTLNSGTLILNSTSAIGTGTLTITGGTLDTLSALTLTNNNAISLNGSLTFGGTSSLNLGTGVVTIGNANRDITLHGASTLTLGELQWNSIANNRTLTVNQGTGSGASLVLGGFQLNINADTAARNRIITGSGNVTISSAVTNGNAFDNGLIYSGTDTLTLSAANTYTGITTVNGGTLKLTGSIATSSSLIINAGTFDISDTAATVSGTLTLGSATTTVAGQTASLISSTNSGSFTLGGNVTYNAGAAGFENGQATISTSLILTADRTFNVNDSPNAAVDLLVNAVISGSFGLIKGTGSGTLRLSGTNTFSGQVILNIGTTEVDSLGNIGVAGSLGTSDKDAASSIIRLGNLANTGTLNYLGTGDSTNRTVQIGSGTNAGTNTGGATILSNGSGALVFSAATLNTAASVGTTGPTTARVLTLGGSNTGANTIQGAIVNNLGAATSGTNAVALVKQDAGVWILAGASTYSGGTTVNGGTLLANNATGSATGTGSLNIASGARLGGSGTAGSLIGGAAFTQQSGAVIFAGQNGVIDAQTLTLQAAGGFVLSGKIELDITGGGASGVLNAQTSNNDLLVFSGGPVTLSGATLSLHTALPITSGTWVAGSSWHLINWSSVSGTFDSVTDLPDLSSLGLAWDLSQLYSSGTLSVAIVPEPSRALLAMIGLSLLLLRRRYHRTVSM